MPPLSFLCPTFAMSSVLVLSSGARTLAGATLLRRKRGLRDESAASPPSSLQQAAEQPGACAPDHHVQPSAVLTRARCERQFIFCATIDFAQASEFETETSLTSI